jgi:UDP-N-acetylglucosamine--N-acetylmuramyl-(pentapeptide) pyrophosphoryl-undecaprenol N-acetylglucosamine transferase
VKIVLACGGSGGHIFPAFSVAEQLKKQHPLIRIVYICGKKDIENAIFKIVKAETVLSVDSAPFRGLSSLWSPSFLIKLSSGLIQAFRILSRERPDGVVGFGGYFSFPVLLAAKAMRIPVILHEQNVIPGVANKFFARLADGVALSFAETERLLPRLRRVHVTGNPIRTAIELGQREEALRFFGFSADKRTLLVLGGSQGAESINNFFLDALQYIPNEWKSRLQVLHLCGKMSEETAGARLTREGVPGRVFSFFERMDLCYAVADLAIGRAGATFLAEIAFKNIRAILIPYPFGGGHQKINAEVFCGRGRAMMIEQKDLDARILARVITEGLESEGANDRVSRKPSGLPNPRVLLADFIGEVIRGT